MHMGCFLTPRVTPVEIGRKPSGRVKLRPRAIGPSRSAPSRMRNSLRQPLLQLLPVEAR